MKKPITLIIACIVLSTATVHAGWFGGNEQQRIQETQRQLDSQRRETGGWQVVAGLLPSAASCFSPSEQPSVHTFVVMKRTAKPRVKPAPLAPAKPVSKVRALIEKYWKPKPINTPAVDPELKHLNGLQRAGEVLRYSVLSIEWWISPNGTLREWLRWNGKLSSILLIPAVLIVPLVTFVLWQVAKWIVLLVQIASNLIVLPLAALAAGILIAGIVIVARMLLGK